MNCIHFYSTFRGQLLIVTPTYRKHGEEKKLIQRIEMMCIVKDMEIGGVKAKIGYVDNGKR